MKLFEKMQKREGVIFVIQAEDSKGRTEISEVLRPDAACEGHADGWGERARAAALTVGLIFW